MISIMADENSNSANEKIVQLTTKLEQSEKQNAELKEQIAKLKDEVEAFKAEKSVKQMKRSIGIGMESKCDEEIIVSKKSKLTKKCTSFVPNWLVEVMAWIKRMEMANSELSYSCSAFNQLCWPKLHENVKARILPGLYFYMKKDKFGHFQARMARIDAPNCWLPIPSIRPPHYITGINNIKIYFLDRHVMHFLECIHSIITGIYFHFNVQRIPVYRYCPKGICQLRRLFEMLVSKSVAFFNPVSLDFLRSYPNADAIMENFQSVETNLDHLNMDFLLRWLAKFRPDQKPKKLNISFIYSDKSSFVSRIKEEFFCSSTAAINFIILFMCDRVDNPNFSVENENTGEILALYENAYNDKFGVHVAQYLVRHPKGSDHLRADWERQMQVPLEKLPSIQAQIVEIGLTPTTPNANCPKEDGAADHGQVASNERPTAVCNTRTLAVNCASFWPGRLDSSFSRTFRITMAKQMDWPKC